MQDVVASVEHIEYVGVDPTGDIEVYEVLIATEFCCAVAAHLVVEGRRFGVVEGVDGKVEHAVIAIAGLCCQGIYVVVILCRLHLQLAGVADVVVAVEVAAVDVLQVYGDEQGQDGDDGQIGFLFS